MKSAYLVKGYLSYTLCCETYTEVIAEQVPVGKVQKLDTFKDKRNFNWCLGEIAFGKASDKLPDNLVRTNGVIIDTDSGEIFESFYSR